MLNLMDNYILHQNWTNVNLVLENTNGILPAEHGSIPLGASRLTI